jgi:hypothetical protein
VAVMVDNSEQCSLRGAIPRPVRRLCATHLVYQTVLTIGSLWLLHGALRGAHSAGDVVQAICGALATFGFYQAMVFVVFRIEVRREWEIQRERNKQGPGQV